MHKFLIDINIHDDNLFTFETTWIGKEVIKFENSEIRIPLLNLEVQNEKIIKYFSIKESAVYIEHSYLLFTNVSRIEKEFAIHSSDRTHFINKIFETITLKNDIGKNEKCFELGGMGIYFNNTYDGVIKFYASDCYLVIPPNEDYRTTFKGMNEYNPLSESWLTNFDFYLKKESYIRLDG